ncbi:MAG: DUF2970 domain-containing protein [Pseudomonadales bacterium]
MNESTDDQKPPTLFQVIFSVLAAGFGVQNSKNRERDFTRGNPLVFIVVGLIFTALFVLTLVGIVNLIL